MLSCRDDDAGPEADEDAGVLPRELERRRRGQSRPACQPSGSPPGSAAVCTSRQHMPPHALPACPGSRNTWLCLLLPVPLNKPFCCRTVLSAHVNPCTQ